MNEKDAWYASPWVWFILFMLALAVSASLYTVKIAMELPNDVLPTKVSKFAVETQVIEVPVEEASAIQQAPQESRP